MNKPAGYDEVKAGGDFTPVELGGHYAIIKQVSEKQSSTGKDMIVVLFDFCLPDAQPEYFSEQFNNDDRADKKWPFSGSKYIMVHDFMDPKKTSRNFKSFCTSVEHSNGFEISWGANWAQQFKGKRIGVVYGEEETEYDGKVSMRRIPKWFCDYNTVNTQKIPMPKYLKTKSAGIVQAAAKDGFINVEADTEEIPF